VYGFEAIDDALVGADYVVIACPLTEATCGLIGAAELAALPVDATLINVARGSIVDIAALVTALQKRRSRGRTRRDGPGAAFRGPPSLVARKRIRHGARLRAHTPILRTGRGHPRLRG